MASNPPGECCILGFRHSGTPTGKIIKLAGKWDAYIATPPAAVANAHPNKAVLYLPDVFGIGENSMLMADKFAAAGYLTLIADDCDADPQPLVGSPTEIGTWLRTGSDGKTSHEPHAIDPIVEAAIDLLRDEHGVTRIGAVGYCFGARYVARHYKSGIDVGFMAHPSWVSDEELGAISGPLSIVACMSDFIFTDELRHRSEAILAKLEHPWQINLFGHVTHGFAVRGDPHVQLTRFTLEQAFKQAVTWFDEWL